MLLKGKTAVITGCNRGIGKAILERTAGSGANVFAVVRKETDEFAEYCAALSAEHSVEIQIVCADFENEDGLWIAIDCYPGDSNLQLDTEDADASGGHDEHGVDGNLPDRPALGDLGDEDAHHGHVI